MHSLYTQTHTRMAPPPLQAIRIVHLLVVSASMLAMVISSAELMETPSPSTTAVQHPSMASLHLDDGSLQDASASLHPSMVLYTMQFSIGNTALSGIPDTGSDLIWTNKSVDSSPVRSCPSNEKGITTTSQGDCTFKREYDNEATVEGVMREAKLTFESSYTTPLLDIGSARVPEDCHDNLPPEPKSSVCKAYARGGVVGLGRGELSLVSQLAQLWLQSFSYCLPDITSQETTGQIKFYDHTAAQIPLEDKTTTELETVEGLQYPYSSRYYVGLKTIQVGDEHVHVPCGNRGMVIDSGTPYSSLPEQVFNDVKKHVENLVKRIKNEKELHEVPNKEGFSCYEGEYPRQMGSMVLHFRCGGKMEIPAKYYFLQEGASKFCLIFKKSQGNMYLLGSYHQQGMHMLFDIKRNTLSFGKRGACGTQSQENHHHAM